MEVTFLGTADAYGRRWVILSWGTWKGNALKAL